MALMNDEFGGRTEMPTPLRLAEARRQGKVARSSDLVAALSTMACLAVLGYSGPRLLSALERMTAAMLGGPSSTLADVPATLAWAAAPALLAAAPVLLAAVLGPVLANLAHVGWVWKEDAFAFRPDRLSPSAGLRQALGPRGLVRGLMTLGKLLACAWVLYDALNTGVPRVMASVGATPASLAWSVGSLLWRASWQLAGAFGVLALVDWLYQRRQHLADLRITPRQLKDDLKRMEGDGRWAGKRRQQAAGISASRLEQSLSGALAVVESPGRLAVAIGAGDDSTPRVVGQLRGRAACQLVRVARASGVPVVQDRQLAAALGGKGAVLESLGPVLVERLAEVIAFAQSQRESAASQTAFGET